MPVSLTAGNRITEQFFTVNGISGHSLLYTNTNLIPDSELVNAGIVYSRSNGFTLFHGYSVVLAVVPAETGGGIIHFPRIQRKKDLMYYSF